MPVAHQDLECRMAIRRSWDCVLCGFCEIYSVSLRSVCVCGCVTVWGNWVILFRKWSSVKEGSRLAGVVWFGATWTLHCFLWNCVSSLWTGVIEWFQHMVSTVFEVIVLEFLTYRIEYFVVLYSLIISSIFQLYYYFYWISFWIFFIIFKVCLLDLWLLSFRFYIRIFQYLILSSYWFYWLFYYLFIILIKLKFLFHLLNFLEFFVRSI